MASEQQPSAAAEADSAAKSQTATNKSNDDKKTNGMEPDAATDSRLPGVTMNELSTAIKVLQAVALLNKKKSDAGLEVYKHSDLRPLRKAVAGCIELQKRCMFQGKTEEEHYDNRFKERSLKRQRTAETAQQRNYLAGVALRRGRVERLKEKQNEAKEEEAHKMRLMIPDGQVETSADGASSSATPMLLDGPATTNGAENAKAAANSDEKVLLPKLRSCYVCKTRFRELHHFYDQLCPECAALNWEKRHQICDLTGRVAIITGSRVKIGYQTCLKLLRAGAHVIATTRFPNSAADTYRKEPDFDRWKDRLQVYGLDLRDVTGLEAFTRFLKMKYSRSGVDIVINNACQTIRRPRGYYVPIVEKEQVLWKEAGDSHKQLLGGCVEFERLRRRLVMDQKQSMLPMQPQSNDDATAASGSAAAAAATPMITADAATTTTTKTEVSVSEAQPAETSQTALVPTATSNAVSTENAPSPFETMGVSHSTAMSQMVVLSEDVGVASGVLPEGVTDINNQQLDLRTTNSWLLKMEEVSTPEVMECMFINAIAPFVLNSRLKPLMTIPADDNTDGKTGQRRPNRFIINVSAMEGKFYRYKMPNHPHTNMAKAALNMMTRTSSEDLAKSHRIYMNAVDTGWINDENPLERASRTAEMNNFQTPIDEIDAASRILDPIFTAVNSEKERENNNGEDGNDGSGTANGGSSKRQKKRQKLKIEYGKFLKDYKETEW